jgi:hypothetical protein
MSLSGGVAGVQSNKGALRHLVGAALDLPTPIKATFRAP